MGRRCACAGPRQHRDIVDAIPDRENLRLIDAELTCKLRDGVSLARAGRVNGRHPREVQKPDSRSVPGFQKSVNVSRDILVTHDVDARGSNTGFERSRMNFDLNPGNAGKKFGRRRRFCDEIALVIKPREAVLVMHCVLIEFFCDIRIDCKTVPYRAVGFVNGSALLADDGLVQAQVRGNRSRTRIHSTGREYNDDVSRVQSGDHLNECVIRHCVVRYAGREQRAVNIECNQFYLGGQSGLFNVISERAIVAEGARGSLLPMGERSNMQS